MQLSSKSAVLLHIQEDDDKCGPACIQMIIGSRDQKAQIPAQDVIAKQIQREGKWASPPGELAKALNHFLNEEGWTLVEKEHETDLLAEIAASLEVYGLPAIVSDGVNDHWWVVFGLDIEPAGVAIHALDPDRKGLDDIPASHKFGDTCQTAENVRLRTYKGDTWTLLNAVINSGPYRGFAVGIMFVQREDKKRQESYHKHHQMLWAIPREVVGPQGTSGNK